MVFREITIPLPSSSIRRNSSAMKVRAETSSTFVRVATPALSRCCFYAESNDIGLLLRRTIMQLCKPTPSGSVICDRSQAAPDVYQHARERRFYEFASLEIEGERFMTPQDFLESVTEESPRRELVLMSSLSNFELSFAWTESTI